MKALVWLFLGILFPLTTFGQITPTEANLRSAVAAGGTITFSSPGAIPITQPIAVSKDTIIDAGTTPITIDGQGATQIFTVASGVHLSLTNVTFANGAAIGPAADSFAAPAPANGGATQNTGGFVTA